MTSFQDQILTERLFARDSKNLLENEEESSRGFYCIRHHNRSPRVGGSKTRKGPKNSVYISLFLLVVLFFTTWVSGTPLHYKSSDNGARTLTNYYSALSRSYQSRAMLDKSLVNYSNRTTPSFHGEAAAKQSALDNTQTRQSQTLLTLSRSASMPSAAVAKTISPGLSMATDDNARSIATAAAAATTFSPSLSSPIAPENQSLRRSSRTSTSRSRQTTSDDLMRRDGFYHSFSSNSGFGRSPSNFLKEPKLSGDSMPVCSHVGDYTNEISAKAYLAGTVFEGKARSKSKVMNEGTYAVTFVVQRVHKDQTSRLNPTPLKVRSQVRLNFSEKPRMPKFAQCDQSYDLAPVRPGEFVRAHIKQGRRYIVFVNGVGPHNYTVLGEPVLQKKKTVQAVKDVLCPKCVRPVSVEGLRDLKLKVKEQLTLVCKCKGNPLPILQWYKDGVHIRASKRTKIQFKKRRSLLVIPKVQMEDAGKYECRGVGVTGSSVTSWATVTIHSRPDNTTMLWPLLGGPCPIDSYCLNGGTCTYYETVGEPVCQCAEGFNGQRCESKDVYNRSKNRHKHGWPIGSRISDLYEDYDTY